MDSSGLQLLSPKGHDGYHWLSVLTRANGELVEEGQSDHDGYHWHAATSEVAQERLVPASSPKDFVGPASSTALQPHGLRSRLGGLSLTPGALVTVFFVCFFLLLLTVFLDGCNFCSVRLFLLFCFCSTRASG